MTDLLTIKNLSVRFKDTLAVDNVSLTLARGQITALVGESGSGKSTVALSILKLCPSATTSGSITLNAENKAIPACNLLSLSDPQLESIRGGKIAMIFQEPMTSLNPLHKVAKQIGEVLALHQNLTGKKAHARTLELLKMVELKNPERKLKSYPHELSGGERQRVMIAMALAGKPDILIADEPTTALDVTIQASIIKLLKRLQKQLDMSILFISHDLKLVERIASHICVMRKGSIVEQGKTKQIFTKPTHSYTIKLVNSVPRGAPTAPHASAPVLIRGENMTVKYGDFTALNHIGIAIKKGSTVGILGESGSGKTTLGLALLDLIKSATPHKQKVLYLGKPIRHMRPFRKDMQIVFQDPYSSLNPRMSIEQIVGEGLKVHRKDLSKAARQALIIDMLEKVGLNASASLYRYPHEFSGGERQRIALARALILHPQFLILDEPTSALDITIQVQILELLAKLKAELNLSYMLITHDIRVIKALADYIYVMKSGKVVEHGSAKSILSHPKHLYTKTLIKTAIM